MGLIIKSMTKVELYEHAGLVRLDRWEKRGVRVPIIDIDNTLTSFRDMTLFPHVVDGLRSQGIADRFVGVGIAADYTDKERVRKIQGLVEMELGIETYAVCAPMDSKRPDPFMGEDIADYFDIETAQLGIIGDRWLTDVRFGQNLGAGAIALCNKVGEGDARFVPLLRFLEEKIVIIEQLSGLVVDNRQLAS
jgi:predicted HAD superfamily phosphohydrolase YqeG